MAGRARRAVCARVRAYRSRLASHSTTRSPCTQPRRKLAKLSKAKTAGHAAESTVAKRVMRKWNDRILNDRVLSRYHSLSRTP